MSDPARRGGDPPSGRLNPVQALVLLSIAFIALPTVGGVLQSRFGISGVAISEVLLVGLPTLIAISLSRVSPITALGLRTPSLRALAGASIAGAAGFYFVAGGLEFLQERVVPIPPEM